MGKMEQVFDGLTGPRRSSGRHRSLHDILVIALCALLAAAAVGCAAEPAPLSPTATLVPPPTATATPEATLAPTTPPAYPPTPSPLNADDLDFLPDDPTELMYATLEHPLSQVGRKMAYSHNDAFIPVLLEFMRFQQDEESQLTLASFLVRIRDDIPEGGFAIVPSGQDTWAWWQEWLALHPEATPPEGYDGWKGQLFSIIDQPMGEFMYSGVPATIRLEEIVWGGVRRDGIPDLRFPPNIAPEEASYLDPGDRVFGVSINGEHRAYPLRVLNAHEMANDIVGGVQFALAY